MTFYFALRNQIIRSQSYTKYICMYISYFNKGRPNFNREQPNFNREPPNFNRELPNFNTFTKATKNKNFDSKIEIRKAK